MRPMVEAVAQPHPAQRLLRPFPALAQGHARVQQPVGDVVQRAHADGEVELLEHEADPPRPQRRHLVVP